MKRNVGTIDKVITDLPFGVRCGLQYFQFARFCRDLARILVPGTGRAVILGQQYKKVKAVLEDSEEFGDVVEIERQPLREKYDDLIKKAQDHMKEVASGGDFAEMLETMDRYEVYNFSKTDKYDSGQ